MDAEIERLRGILAFCEGAAAHERDGLRAEVERLKAAKEKTPATGEGQVGRTNGYLES